MLLEQHESDFESIKHVAAYLRKSQSMGDKDEDLLKHKSVIEEVCESRGWSYVLYEEVVTGDTIEGRPKMLELLSDVERSQYDAIFCFDIDRLGRGGGGDREKIGITLQHSDTYLITANPYKIYDLNNENDDQAYDMQSFMGRFEYKMIKKRFKAGKRIGLRLGRWVNAQAPHGYTYNRKLKQLEVDEEKRPIIRKIVEHALEGMTLADIAWELNKKHIPSPRNKKWAPITISRMLKSQVYLGHIVGNKSEGNRKRVATSSSKPFKYLPEDKWVIVKNCHEPLITEEEYDLLMKRFSNRPKRIYNNKIHSFTGLITCGKCNKNMTMKRFGNGKLGVAKCECGNRGGDIELVEKAVIDTVEALRDNLNNIQIDDVEKQKKNMLNKKLDDLIQDCDKQDLAIERIEEAFENGLYDIQKTRKKTEERQQEKWKLEKEIRNIRKQLTSVDSFDSKERITAIDKFISDIENEDSGEIKNKIYKDILNNIVWTRDNEKRVSVKVNFL
ncbi:hypothetical protein CIL05_07850 [Virgibacillus profundi]|uniref:Recombinase n=1 Tax=Virgibacillus profundi TaxID=2024555 RepID=A0A2A2IGX0_9BACI|nr:recombinase family protein [Virgibacillus profundi]PAV30375.1 hypothetical protein CIL05_07850 [Virgibacillus profundi]PXY54547.1 hypothetical protein CIT14_07935 [Virgibacillus profundi]